MRLVISHLNSVEINVAVEARTVVDFIGFSKVGAIRDYITYRCGINSYAWLVHDAVWEHGLQYLKTLIHYPTI